MSRGLWCKSLLCFMQEGAAQAWCRASVLGRLGRQMANKEFLQKVADGGGADTDPRIFEGEFRSLAVVRGIVKVRDAAGGEAAEDAGIVCLPVSVVAFADDGVRDGVHRP